MWFKVNLFYSKYLRASQGNHFYKDIQNDVFCVERRNITIKLSIWFPFRIDKLSFTVNGLNETKSKFAIGVFS